MIAVAEVVVLGLIGDFLMPQPERIKLKSAKCAYFTNLQKRASLLAVYSSLLVMENRMTGSAK